MVDGTGSPSDRFMLKQEFIKIYDLKDDIYCIKTVQYMAYRFCWGQVLMKGRGSGYF